MPDSVPFGIVLGLVGVIIVLITADGLERTRRRARNPHRRRGWDRYDPLQKLAIASAGIVALLLLGRACLRVG